MLQNIDLSQTIEKADYKKTKAALELQLVSLQRKAIDAGVPVLILLEGWDAAGKGSLINELILPLDPRGFKVHNISHPTTDETMRPFLWRFWIRTPPRGRIAIFDRGWYWPLWTDRVRGQVNRRSMESALRDISAFERQLVDGGTAIIKLFLHIDKREQKRRFNKLRRNKATAWRVTKEDLKRHRQYAKYLDIIEQTLPQTDTDFAPWTIIESHDRRHAILKTYRTVISLLETRLNIPDTAKPTPAKPAKTAVSLVPGILETIQPNQPLDEKAYRKRLDKAQVRIRELEHDLYVRRIPVILAYEGWDAAGKGGNLRRLVQRMDPRGYEVVPIGAPNDAEKAQHYLWRFWRQIPKAGHLTIFDRSWYGRVLVERVEGFCTEADWKRAYREINEMEQHLANFGAVILKFWLHIDPAEQLRRFQERERTPHKQWKITAEDWRNRKQWNRYQQAVNEMIYRTSTPYAPWVIVESNCKWFARVKVLESVIEAIENQLRKS